MWSELQLMIFEVIFYHLPWSAWFLQELDWLIRNVSPMSMHSINPCVGDTHLHLPPGILFVFSLLSWLGGSSFRGFHLAFPSTMTYFTGQRTNVNVRVMPPINYIHSDCTFENGDDQQLVFKASPWSISHTKSRRWSWDRHTSPRFSHAAFAFTNWRFVATLHQVCRCHLLTSRLCATW